MHPALVLSAATLALGALLPSSLRADVVNTARVTINPNFSGGGGPIDHIVSHPGTCDATGSTTGGINSSGSGICHTEYGLIRMGGQAIVSLGTTCFGSFHDTITITSPGVTTGTPGTLTFGVRISGSISASSGTSVGRWSVQADVGGGIFDLNRGAHFNSPTLFPAGYAGDAFGTYTATISFQYGVAMPLDVEFSGQAGASNGSDGLGSASFGGPLLLTWQGISDVHANGNPIPSYTLVAQSGTNWTPAYNLCIADVDDGTGSGTPDGGVTIDDLLYYLNIFEQGTSSADVDDGTGTGTPDGGVTIDDLLYYLQRFEAGC